MPLYDIQPLPTATGWRQWLADRPQLPYLIPLLAFLAVMAPGSFFDHALGFDWKKIWFTYLPAVYTVKTLLAALLLYLLWDYYTPIKWNNLSLGFVVGVLGVPLWVATEYFSQKIGLTHPPNPSSLYIPPIQIPNNAARYLFYFIRVGGPTLVVPIMEELFFRDFLMRALIRGARFQEVPIGKFTWFSLLGMSALFAINHIQWPSGLLYGLLMGVLLIRTKSLGSCIIAHGTTNLFLYAAYCIPHGDWQFM